MPLAVVVIMAALLVLRLVQLSSSALSPLTYQLGPDEDYYFRFARAVLAGGADRPEFLFMDPLYGYLVAAIFKLAGPSVFIVFAIQCVLDAGTAVALLLIGRELGKPRAGLIAAALYGLTSTALMFACSLLKEVWVCAFASWWVLLALKVSGSSRYRAWFAFGLYCGVGVALRSTALLFLLAGMLLPLLGVVERIHVKGCLARAALLAAGAIIALAPCALRNYHAGGSLSPLPFNSGIVLHQAYNAQNPDSVIWIPAFVNYLNPSEIWRGYAAEAERRVGRHLDAHEIDAIWKGEALGYMTAHPRAVITAVGSKVLKFFAAADTPINRSLEEEGLFSPVIRFLPVPAPWLLSLGLAGLVAFARTDRRWRVVCVPVAVSFLTVAVFWAEDRFRFHALPILALGAGLLIDFVASAFERRAVRDAALASGAAASLLAGSFALGRTVAPTPLHWDQVVWGYIKMNNPREATVVADDVLRRQPENGAVWEAAGYLAVLRHDFAGAERAYRHALISRPQSDLAHFDLAKVLERLGRRGEALDEANRALALREDSDYRQLAHALTDMP